MMNQKVEKAGKTAMNLMVNQSKSVLKKGMSEVEFLNTIYGKIPEDSSTKEGIEFFGKTYIINKMIKIFLFFIIIIFGVSCNLIKTISIMKEQQSVININTSQKFSIGKHNKLLIPTEINDTAVNMYFDTRAPDIIFIKSGSFTDNLPIVSAPKNRQLKAAGGEQIESKFVKIDSASCKLFTIRNWIINGIYNKGWVCSEAIGIIGHPEFSLGKE